MGQIAFGRARHGKKSTPQRRNKERVQKVFGSCAAKTATQIDDSMQARDNGHERVWKDFLKRILILEEERLPAKNA